MSDQKQDSLFSCANICWMIAVVLGFAAFMVALSQMDLGAILSMVIGIVAFFFFGWILGKAFCSETQEVAQSVQAPVTPQTPVEPQTPVTPVAPVAPVTPDPVKTEAPEVSEATEAPAAAAVSDVVVKSSLLEGEQELADRKGAYKYEAEKPAKKAPAKKAPAKKAAAKKTPAKKAAAKPVAKSAEVVVEAAAASEKKPRTMKAARKAGADDLKLLKGVGPKLEQTLNELGFFHFDQVSKWAADEIAWVDARLKFKGRIERDGWIDQAKILADGGETEFSKRSKKA